MCNILANCYKDDKELISRIKGLPEQVAFNYYGKMLRIIDITEELDNFEDIKTIRLKSLEELVLTINR